MRAAQAEKSSMQAPDREPFQKHHPDWTQLLVDAVQKPGIISTAYSKFWNYSVGNGLLAISQCLVRGLEPGPIHTFRGWLDLGRHVRKGERALVLCLPLSVKRKVKQPATDPNQIRVGDGAERQIASQVGAQPDANGAIAVTVFTYKPHWFVLSQTEGQDFIPAALPAWNERRAFHALLIDRVRFDHPNGNCQGFALGRSVSVSPIAVLPHKTLLHELAHVVLGHTEEGTRLDDHELTPRNLREVEAECVALICCESLNLTGTPECRGYIQNWLGKDQIPERSAQKIFKAADAILRAGRPQADSPQIQPAQPTT